MQDIIDKILDGELSQKQLIEELVNYNDTTIAEYDEAVTVVENNQIAINKLEADARQREDNIKTIEKNALLAVDYAKKLESDNISLKAANKDMKALKAENKKLKAQTKGRQNQIKKPWQGLNHYRQIAKNTERKYQETNQILHDYD